MWTFIFLMEGILDCFSIEHWHLFIVQNVYAGVHLLQFLNALTCSPIRLFFRLRQIASNIVPILHNKPCICIGG